MAQIQGEDVVISLRESGTTGSYLTLVCETNNSMQGSANVTTVVTKCSTIQSVANPAYTFSFDALAESAPTGSQVSYEQMLSWFNGNTLLDIKRENPAGGANFYFQSTCYISELSDAAPAEGAFSFSGTLAVTGTVDIIP